MFMEERVHPIPFRTRQLSSPSSMILRTLTWESRTTPRLYFQRAVLSRTALCFARTHPHHGPPLPKPQARRKPLMLLLPFPPPFGFLPPSFFFLRLYPPGSLHNRLIRFLSTFCIHLSRGPENLWVRRRGVLIEMHGSHAVSMKKGQEKGRDVLGNSSPAT